MGTKNNPGAYDCYANAEPDEPMFVLLARDIRAPYVVEAWCALAKTMRTDPKKIAEARQCAEKMRQWRLTQKRGMDKDKKIKGIVWRYNGNPTKQEFEAFLKRSDAVLRIVRVDGRDESVLPLFAVPCSSVWEDHEYVCPVLIRVGDVERWEVPKEVAEIRLSFNDGSYHCMDMRRVAQKR